MPKRNEYSNIELDFSLILNIQNAMLTWGKTNFSDFPWRTSSNDFYGLLAELMLQRTRAEQVLPIYLDFIRKYPSCSDAANDDSKNIEKILNPLGLNWRIKNILKLIEALHDRKCNVPDTKDELLQLPGVGLYTANAFLSLHKNVKSSIVDSNVIRILSRVFGLEVDSETHKKKWFHRIADKITPEKDFREFNYAILDLSRMICKKNPLCKECPLVNFCIYVKS